MSDSFPIGAVTAFAGVTPATPTASAWMLCDGALLSANDPAFGALFKVIGRTYGGSEADGTFALPDYRGRFMRGADGGAGSDPDVATRRRHADEHPRPDGHLADPVGDGVGTIQDAALARPKTKFTALFDHLPESAKSTAATIGTPPEAAAWNDGSASISTMTGGGDAETRPINLYVDFYIKFSDGK